jgi:pimeloyl-ACP methyl ester carboxylesterase
VSKIGTTTSRKLTVPSGDVSLAGTLWLPAVGEPAAAVLMHPGSGPSDRYNDVFFPPIREHLLESGFAVCSFDKRGVGGSTGRWEDAAIVEQADDALACVAALLEHEELAAPVGLFGYSQGGWVVIEAAGRGAPTFFVVSSSGPGVTPAAQERFAHHSYLSKTELTPDEIDDAMQFFDGVVEMARNRVSFEDLRARIQRGCRPAVYEKLDLTLFPDDPELWDFFGLILDYSPRPALERIRVPLLALFGGDDQIVPVDDSVAVYHEVVRSDLLTLAVFPGADHRVQTGDPPRMADGYLETLSSFVLAAVT